MKIVESRLRCEIKPSAGIQKVSTVKTGGDQNYFQVDSTFWIHYITKNGFIYESLSMFC